ncbi:hypothetical protein KDK95_30245 [Actinospica sp. MGRD01-02]|uniref:Uncharacterized protein n=1 Tax=Actinospica acidithermotolerans TaxID=2828514 RepID=A0A941IPN8_9ACTN|nr:hypothetical protein [Actinospica acidithermotolerans]MBR7830621.1 hypothetical protein [Actinospica acidithermotolerans]
MADETGRAIITREQALACLEILGLEGPPAGPGEFQRAEALGHLLFLVEASALADTDRLDQEALSSGYATAANMIVTGSMGIDGDARTLVTLRLLSRTVEDRLRRTRLDLAALDTPLESDGAWSPYDAVSAALDAILALLARPAPPFVFDGSAPFELRAMRTAIETADRHARTALSRLGNGVRVIEQRAKA